MTQRAWRRVCVGLAGLALLIGLALPRAGYADHLPPTPVPVPTSPVPLPVPLPIVGDPGHGGGSGG